MVWLWVELCPMPHPPKNTPGPQNGNLFGDRVVVDIISWVKMCHTTAGWALNPIQPLSLLGRREKPREVTWRQRQREYGPMRMEMETGVTLPETKEHQGPTGCQEERRKEHPTRGFREHMALPAPWLETSSLQNCERVRFCCFLNCFTRFYLKWLYVISFLKLSISKVDWIICWLSYNHLSRLHNYQPRVNFTSSVTLPIFGPPTADTFWNKFQYNFTHSKFSMDI